MKMMSAFKKTAILVSSFALALTFTSCTDYLEEFQDENEYLFADDSGKSGDTQKSDDGKIGDDGKADDGKTSAKSSASKSDDGDKTDDGKTDDDKTDDGKESAKSSASKSGDGDKTDDGGKTKSSSSEGSSKSSVTDGKTCSTKGFLLFDTTNENTSFKSTEDGSAHYLRLSADYLLDVSEVTSYCIEYSVTGNVKNGLDFNVGYRSEDESEVVHVNAKKVDLDTSRNTAAVELVLNEPSSPKWSAQRINEFNYAKNVFVKKIYAYPPDKVNFYYAGIQQVNECTGPLLYQDGENSDYGVYKDGNSIVFGAHDYDISDWQGLCFTYKTRYGVDSVSFKFVAKSQDKKDGKTDSLPGTNNQSKSVSVPLSAIKANGGKAFDKYEFNRIEIPDDVNTVSKIRILNVDNSVLNVLKKDKCPSGGELWYGNVYPSKDSLYEGDPTPYKNYYTNNASMNVLEMDSICVDYDDDGYHGIYIGYDAVESSDDETDWWHVSVSADEKASYAMFYPSKFDCSNSTCLSESVNDGYYKGDIKPLLARSNFFSFNDDNVRRIFVYRSASDKSMDWTWNLAKTTSRAYTIFEAAEFKNVSARLETGEINRVEYNANTNGKLTKPSDNLLRFEDTHSVSAVGLYNSYIAFKGPVAQPNLWNGLCLEIAASGNFEVQLKKIDGTFIAHTANLITPNGPELKCLPWTDFTKNANPLLLDDEELMSVNEIRVVLLDDGTNSVEIRNIYSYQTE
ncbi:MAG: hypothetical protein MJY99_11265 [Fibrobacter sp.]|nr:hypothetical protein [Fibrobacter sp.]